MGSGRYRLLDRISEWLLVLCHVAGFSNLDTTELSGKPDDQILLEFSKGDTHSKYLSQGLVRMFGSDFIKRPDVSEWLNQEILTYFKQFVANKYLVSALNLSNFDYFFLWFSYSISCSKNDACKINVLKFLFIFIKSVKIS